MFDRLIECEPEGGAEFHGRKSYFVVSSVVVGILFVTAVVISIYATDFSLGNGAFDLVQVVAPTEMAPVEPEIERARPDKASTSRSELPTRQVNMQRPDEQPVAVPTTTSVVQNNQLARPSTPFAIAPVDSTPTGESSGRQPSSIGGSGEPATGLTTAKSEPAAEKEAETGPPPPVVKKAPLIAKSGGVLNGRATDLPKPTYSAAAKAMGAQGQVSVQVTIDESGRVISASAVSGNPLLRPAAEQAARQAKFTPTTLTGVPVKVTGVIVYNFTR
jgi:TonB family protein